MSRTACPASSSGTVTTCDMPTALPSRHYGPQPEPPGTDEQAERSISAVRGGASLDDSLEVALSEVEGLLPGYLAELRGGPTPRRGTEARNDISDLLALQVVRTPEHVC